MELRIEDHPTPIKELKRLVKLHRAYDHMNKGDLALEHNDVEAALQEYGAALPGPKPELAQWRPSHWLMLPMGN